MLAFLTVEEHLEGFRLKFKDGETVDSMHTIMGFQKFWIILYAYKYHGSSYTYCVHNLCAYVDPIIFKYLT